MSAKKRTIDAFFGSPKSNTTTSAKKARASPGIASSLGDEVLKYEDLEDYGVVSLLPGLI